MDSHVPSYRVIEAIAQKEGVSLTELTPPLYTVIDPDALDALIQKDVNSNTNHVVVEFTYRNYVVRVQNSPTVSVSVREVESQTAISESVANQLACSEEY